MQSCSRSFNMVQTLELAASRRIAVARRRAAEQYSSGFSHASPVAVADQPSNTGIRWAPLDGSSQPSSVRAHSRCRISHAHTHRVVAQLNRRRHARDHDVAASAATAARRRSRSASAATAATSTVRRSPLSRRVLPRHPLRGAMHAEHARAREPQCAQLSEPQTSPTLVDCLMSSSSWLRSHSPRSSVLSPVGPSSTMRWTVTLCNWPARRTRPIDCCSLPTAAMI